MTSFHCQRRHGHRHVVFSSATPSRRHIVFSTASQPRKSRVSKKKNNFTRQICIDLHQERERKRGRREKHRKSCRLRTGPATSFARVVAFTPTLNAGPATLGSDARLSLTAERAANSPHQRITTAATAKTPDPKVSSPTEVIRSHVSLSPRTSPMPIVRHHRTTTATSTDPKVSSPSTLCYSGVGGVEERESSNSMTHSLSGRFPSVSLFKEYQTAALAILEKSDYTLISGNPYIKKTGWRKISCYFNISYEIKDKTIEFDEDRNVHRAEFVVRAYMHGGRFSDGWGSCDRREKRFLKPNNDIPSTAETRAKNKACQDLLGIGGPGSSRAKY